MPYVQNAGGNGSYWVPDPGQESSYSATAPPSETDIALAKRQLAAGMTPAPEMMQYIQGGSVTYPGGSSPLNPNQFATETEAQRLAKLYGGTASGQQLQGPGYGYVGPDGKPITQQQLNIPGAPSPLNAGLVSGALSQYPGGYGAYEVGRDATGNYGASPYDTRINASAVGMPKGYIDEANANPVTTQADVKASAANYAAYHPTTPPPATAAPAGASRPATPGAPGGAPAGPGAIPRPVPAAPGAPATPPRTSIYPQTANSLSRGYSGAVPANGQVPATGGPTDAPTGSGLGSISYGETGSGWDTGGAWSQDPTTGQWTQGQAPSGGQQTAPPDTGGGGGGGGGTFYAPPSGPGYGPGYAPSGSGYAPNSGYQFQNPYGVPRANDPYRAGSPVQPMYSQPNGEGLQYKTENDRAMAINQGLALQGGLRDYTNYQQGRANDYEGAANSAYGGIASGQGGYSDAEKGAIQQQGQLNAMQLSPDQANANYLTEGEQAGITGNPYEAYQNLGQGEQQIDQTNLDRQSQVRGALNTQNAGIDAGLAASGTNVRNAMYDNRRKQYQNLSDTAALTRDQQNQAANNVRGALNYGEDTARGQQDQAASNIRGALNYGEDTTRSYIDPAKLGLSDQYKTDYNVGARDLQNIRDKAGRAVGSQTAMDEERLGMAANAAGNTSPLAIAAARSKLRQQGAVNSANAMSDAEIAAKQLQLNTAQQRESTRLGAEGNLANLGTSTELTLGGRRTAAEQGIGAQGVQNEQTLGARRTAAEQGLGSQGLSNEQNLGAETLGTQNTLSAAEQGAEQYLGNQTQQAEQFKGAAGVGAEQALGAAGTASEQYKTSLNAATQTAAEKAASDRAAQLATNRQATSVGNQTSQLGRQQYAYGQTAQNNTNFANVKAGQESDYRNYLTGQGTQANQATQVGNQQQIGAYGTQTGAQNAASGNEITNYKVPGIAEKQLGAFGLSKGGVESGPTNALVGEAGPELIIDLAPQEGGEYGARPIKKLAGGGVYGYDPNDYYSQMYGQGPDTGSGETSYEGNSLPTSVAGSQVKHGQDLASNPLYETVRRGLYQPSQPQGAYPSDPSGGGSGQGLGKQLTSSLMQAGLKALFPAAHGAVVAPGASQHHPYGMRGLPHLKAELVTSPQVRELGKYGAQAVVPLTPRKSNKVHMSDLPALEHEYGGYGA